jgi:uncharacterized repeat protein (TIGR03803 family)
MSLAKFTGLILPPSRTNSLPVAALFALLLIPTHPAQAQTETVLYNFPYQGSEGSEPLSRLAADGKGNLYGTTWMGGAGFGTVYELSPNDGAGWNETVLYTFSGGADGGIPDGYMMLDGAGNLYGTTLQGGTTNRGVVFELSPAGSNWTEAVLYSFCQQSGCTDGFGPFAGLILDSAGNLYGTSYGGIFELSPSANGWTEQLIFSSDFGALTMDASGNLFVNGASIFELSPNGNGGWTPTVLHTFHSLNIAIWGGYPGSPLPLVFDQMGNLYGTRAQGGVGFGVVYKLSPGKNGKWTKEDLYTFSHGPDAFPWPGILLDAAGNIYGTTAGRCGTINGAAHRVLGGGTVFELEAPVGAGSYRENVLWSFNSNNGIDGAFPLSGLIMDSSGNLYGTTPTGGSGGGGVVFEVTP